MAGAVRAAAAWTRHCGGVLNSLNTVTAVNAEPANPTSNHIHSTVSALPASVPPGHQLLNNSKNPTQPASEITIIQKICCLMFVCLGLNMTRSPENCNDCYRNYLVAGATILSKKKVTLM
jgi:hypothetical protein